MRIIIISQIVRMYWKCMDKQINSEFNGRKEKAMKIYFEDGELRSVNQLSVKPDIVIDAGKGLSESFRLLDFAKETNPNCIIYTNAITAFNNRYAWNDSLKVPEIYIRAGEHLIFTRIDNLTERELREGHALAKLYISGEFDEIKKKPN